MNFESWYTDTVDIWRVVSQTNNNLTTNTREELYTAIPCRIYHVDKKGIKMDQTAASITQEDKLACDNTVDIRAGDELIIHRGGALGAEVAVIRAFAGVPNYYFEPVGNVMPGLAHQEVKLLQQERVS